MIKERVWEGLPLKIIISPRRKVRQGRGKFARFTKNIIRTIVYFKQSHVSLCAQIHTVYVCEYAHVHQCVRPSINQVSQKLESTLQGATESHI